MVRRNPSHLTAESYARLPDDGLCDELVRGRVVREPPPGGRHGRVAATIACFLQSWARRTGAGVVYACDAGFLLARDPDTVRGPDVAYLSRARFRSIDDAGFVEGAPDLAVEVLSPSNRRTAMREKVADYLAAGAAAVWVADPKRQTITVYRRGEAQVLRAVDTLKMPALLPDFAMRVGEAFALPWDAPY